MSTHARSKAKTRTPLTDEQRAERRQADRAFAAQAVAALHASDGWQAWLRVRAAFRTYSLHNQLLIAMQRPGASRVAGFRAWLRLGYCVARGERAIRIRVPIAPTKAQLAHWREQGSDPAQRPRTHFRLGPVFDRSQVQPLPGADPMPLDPPIRELDGDELRWALAPLRQLAASLKCTVAIEPLPDGVGGSYHRGSRKITLAAGRSPDHRVHTLVHELAHALVDHDRRSMAPTMPSLTYAEEEVIVESITFTVVGGLGVDTSGFAIPYLASWSGGELAVVQQAASFVDATARTIEDALSPVEPSAPEH